MSHPVTGNASRLNHRFCRATGARPVAIGRPCLRAAALAVALAACQQTPPDASVAVDAPRASTPARTAQPAFTLHGTVIEVSTTLTAPTEARVGRLLVPVGHPVATGDAVVELFTGSSRVAARGGAGAAANRLELRASGPGTVAGFDASPGARVTPGGPVVTLTRSDRLQVRFDVDPQLLGRLTLGLVLQVAGGTVHEPFSVMLHRIDPAVDARTHRAGAYADLPPTVHVAVGEMVTATASIRGDMTSRVS